MNSIAVKQDLVPTSQKAIDEIREIENHLLTMPQEEVITEHTLHAGMYARTMRVGPGVVFTNALIKISTILIVNGDIVIFTDNGPIELSGFNVLTGSAGRKHLVVTKTAMQATMVFPTNATTVDEAEREFTDEFEKLISRG